MRLLRTVAFFAVAGGLSGCLIQQEAPTPVVQTAKMINFKGLVTMLELRFLNSGAAAILAGFNRIDPVPAAATAAASSIRVTAQDRRAFERVSFAPWSAFGFIDPTKTDRGGECRKISQPRDGMRDIPATPANGPVSLGQVQFGPEHQTAFKDLLEDSHHQYGLALAPPVPAGTYLIRAEGNKSLPLKGFEMDFAMPEALSGIRFNGHYLDRPGVEISRSQPLRIDWDSLSVPNDRNALAVILVSETVTDQHILVCAGREAEVSAMDAHGEPSWTIDPSWLSDLYEGDGTQVYFTREILGGAEGGTLHLDVEGIRKWMSVAIIRN